MFVLLGLNYSNLARVALLEAEDLNFKYSKPTKRKEENLLRILKKGAVDLILVYSWFLINITGQIFFHPKLKRGVTKNRTSKVRPF